MELLAKLGIDWKLLLAQIVNFTILVGVLSYFVYKPLLNLLDERRERIRKAMEDAKHIENQKKEMEVIKADRLKKIDQEMGTMLENARRDAERMKEEILASAKQQADQMIEKATRQIEDERGRVLSEVQGSLARMILRMTEKIVRREFAPADQSRLLSELEKDLPAMLK
jgi:F-type H+-transporting ATPase subunit b